MRLRRFIEVVEGALIVFMAWFGVLVAHYSPVVGDESGTIVPNLLQAMHSTDVTFILAILSAVTVAAAYGLLRGRHQINQLAMIASGTWWLFVAVVALDSAPWGTAVPAYALTASLCFSVWLGRRHWGDLL